MVLAGGMESMNRVPYVLPRARTGYRMGNAELVDLLVQGLTCPLTHVHMGVTAENVAERHGITRAEQDAFAAASYEKALKAIAGGKFRQEITPFEIPQKKGDPIRFDTDEDPVPTSLDKLAGLRGCVQEGRYGHRGQLLQHRRRRLRAADRLGGARCASAASRRWRASAATASAGRRAEPTWDWGRRARIPRLMQRLGWGWDSVDLWELNEAFAAQSLGVLRELDRIDRRAGQRARRGDRPGPPRRGLRGANPDHPDLRPARPRAAAGRRIPLYWQRNGHRHGDRARLTARCGA